MLNSGNNTQLLEKRQDIIQTMIVSYLLNDSFPLTFKITPQNHSSTIKFEVLYRLNKSSHIQKSLYESYKSFELLERLTLRERKS